MCRPKGSYSDAANRDAIASGLGYQNFGEAVVALYQQQVSPSRMAKTFECSPFAIWVRLKNAGVTMRPRGGNQKKRLT